MRQNETVKYCSDKCRGRKANRVDKQIESLILALLNGESSSGIEQTAAVSRRKKGDSRVVISCDEVERLYFGIQFAKQESEAGALDPQQAGQLRAEQRERVRRAARRAVVFGLSATHNQSSEMRSEADSEHHHVRMCEAVVDGAVVEPSFAKGDWCLRYRD